MNIDTSGSPYAAMYAALADAPVATPTAEKADSPKINIDSLISDAKNNQATEDLRELKNEIENNHDMGTQERQGLLSKLEEQLIAQFTKSLGEKDEPVTHQNKARAAEINNEKLANSYQMQPGRSSSSYSSVA